MINDETLRQAAHSLRADRVHGAMELAVRAVDLSVELLQENPDADIRVVARALATVRPSMAAIPNAVAMLLAPVLTDSKTVESLRAHAEQLKRQWAEDATRLIEHSAIHIPKVLLTYSNSSSTRAALIAHAARIRQVILPEGRPINDGKRLARLLAEAGIPVTVITEAQIGWWMREVEAVIVGADTIAPDGSIYNHMGTATVALLARTHNVPMYVLTHTLKGAPYHRPEDMAEENDPTEVWRDPPPGIMARNPAFDCTPPDGIIIITERGVLTDTLRSRVVLEHRTAWEALGLAK